MIGKNPLAINVTHKHDWLAGEWMHPVNGYIAVPEGPGLGIEVDERAVERYRVN